MTIDSKNFKDSEFACNCGTCVYSSSAYVKPHLITMLELARHIAQDIHPSAFVIISSGRRCSNYNTYVKGEKDSKHIAGEAGDCHFFYKDSHGQKEKFSIGDLQVVYNKLSDLFPNCYGIGFYKISGFLHIDINRRRWRKVLNA